MGKKVIYYNPKSIFLSITCESMFYVIFAGFFKSRIKMAIHFLFTQHRLQLAVHTLQPLFHNQTIDYSDLTPDYRCHEDLSV